MNMQAIKYLPLLFPLLLGFISGYGQDPYFSQFYAVPVHLNPALTGGYDGKYRVSAIYRDQWRGPLEKAITNLGAAIDLKFDVSENSNDAAAVGLQFLSDRAGSFNLSGNSIALSGAFHKTLDKNGTRVLSAGAQLITVQKNILYENIVFHDQFNGVDAFDQPTFEDLPENNFSYGDLAVGLNYAMRPKPNTLIFAGASLHHVLEPEVSFYKNDDDELQQAVSSSRLFRRYSVHGGIQFPTLSNFLLSPRLLIMKQGPHSAIQLGNNFIFESRKNNWKMHLGAWLRIVQDFDDAIQPEALGFLFGVNLENLLIGLSYDLNLRDLVNYQTGQGALELSISYFGLYESDGGSCPSF